MGSRAVVIGVGEYAESEALTGYPSIGASAAAYASVIGRDPWWSEHGMVEVLTTAQTREQAAVLEAVERAATAASSPEDRLLVVYVGHGTFWTDQNAGEVHLAASGSRPGRPYTWISQNALYRAMRRSDAGLKVLVADACHSNKLTALENGRPGLTPGLRATCVISAAGAEQPLAWAQPCPELADDPELAGCTPFSGHLLRLVREGSVTARDDLPLPTLHHLLRTEMDGCSAGHAALPEIMSTGWAFTATLFTNRRRGVPPAPAAPEDTTALGILRGGHDTLARLADDPALAAAAIIDVTRRYDAEGSVVNAQDVLLETLRERPEDLATYLATLHQGREEDPDVPRLVVQLIRRTHEYLAQLEPERFVRMIGAMRAAGHEGMALEVLRDFGRHPEPARLVELTEGFHHSDRSFVLTAAALGRPIDDAAALAARIFDPERGDAMRDTIGWHIAIQVSDQRLVPDVARFIHRIRRLGNDELADWMLLLFGRGRSDRPAYDKAMLYFALRHHGLHDDAERLLGRTLEVAIERVGGVSAEEEQPPAAASDDPTRDLLAAFQHLSPEAVVERWFEARFTDPRITWSERSRVARLAAALLIAYPASNARLLAHVARVADARCLVVIAAELARNGRGRMVDALRDQAAERSDETFLVDLLQRWAADRDLTDRVDGLIAAVVTSPDGSVRPAEFVLEVAEALDQERAGESLRRRFRHAAATEVAGRSGEDLVRMLRDIPSVHHRARAERELGRRLALALADGTLTPRRLADHLGTLSEARLGLAAVIACRELSDAEGEVAAERLVETALALGQTPEMRQTGWYLLERFLENEERISPGDVVTVAGLLVLGSAVDGPAEDGRDAEPPLDTRLLLRATVGRWSDARRRDEAVRALRTAGLAEAAGWALAALR